MKRKERHWVKGLKGLFSSPSSSSEPPCQSQNFLKIPLYINEKEIWWKWRRPGEKAKGLMGRKHLGQERDVLHLERKTITPFG